jgi:hypothetical protein
LEHKYVSALLAMPGAAVHPIFDGVADLPLGDLDRGTFMDRRGAILESEPRRVVVSCVVVAWRRRASLTATP